VFRNETVAGGVSTSSTSWPVSRRRASWLASFQALGIRIALERDNGELARLQALGTPPVAYFLGKAAQVLATSTLQLTSLLLVARFAFDVPMPIDTAHWLTSPWVAVLGSLSGMVLGVAVSLLPHQGRSADTVVASIALVLQFFSGVFFVFSRLPAWMRDVAAIFPLKWLTQGMRSRSCLTRQARRGERVVAARLDAAVLIAWIVVGLVVCARSFRWRSSD